MESAGLLHHVLLCSCWSRLAELGHIWLIARSFPVSAALQKELDHTIKLHPSYFGPKITEVVLQKLYADVEGTTTGRYG